VDHWAYSLPSPELPRWEDKKRILINTTIKSIVQIATMTESIVYAMV